MNLNPLAAEEQFLNPLDRVNGFDIRPGLYEINGATSFGSCVNFTIHSQNAVSCELLLFHRGKKEPYGTIPFPEGEGQEAFLERTRLGFEQMMEHLMDLQCREAAFVVHGGTIMAVLSAFSQTGGDFYDWQVSNGSGYSAIAEEESWRQGKKQLTEIEKL